VPNAHGDIVKQANTRPSLADGPPADPTTEDLQKARRSQLRLVASDLAMMRNGRTLFTDLSFTLGPGEALAVRGANGAGKSTLLRIAAGLLAPTAGHIAVEPNDESEGPSLAHYVGHLDGLKPALTVTANLQFWRRVWGGRGDVPAALDAMALGNLAHLHVATLSAGQRRRLALARLLIAERPLWLLDEPTTALDQNGETQLGDLLRRHLAAGGMALVATHRDLLVAAARTLTLGAA
jgi:heme exporter protein A